MRGLSLVAASGGHSSSRCAGLSLSQPLLLRSTGSRRAGSVVVAHGPSCSVACGIFPGQGLNPCPLHWQADSQPLRHQGSPNPLSKSLQPSRLEDCQHNKKKFKIYNRTISKVLDYRKVGKPFRLEIIGISEEVSGKASLILSEVLNKERKQE